MAFSPILTGLQNKLWYVIYREARRCAHFIKKTKRNLQQDQALIGGRGGGERGRRDRGHNRQTSCKYIIENKLPDEQITGVW